MALLSLLIFLQPFGEYAAVWEQARLWPVMLAYGLTVPMVLLRAWQAACLARLQRISVGFGSLVGLQLATTFYGLFAPGIVAAGMLRWYRLARLSGETGATLALVVFSRMLEIEIALLLGLCFWLADSAAPGAVAGVVSWAAAGIEGAAAGGGAVAGSTAETEADGAAAPAVRMRAGTSPAAGQGSPPSTRGRPRRIFRERVAIATSSEPQVR